ncbi:hypothetical protein [Mycobacterium sp.]|uniref:hypothetical protein n=1 Tax=Mycobacterium sp. TaxID=1785 RepID=UPI003F95DDDF
MTGGAIVTTGASTGWRAPPALPHWPGASWRMCDRSCRCSKRHSTCAPQLPGHRGGRPVPAGPVGVDRVDLEPGALVWLPRRSRRQFSAGPAELRYRTVHQRREALVLHAPVRRAVR